MYSEFQIQIRNTRKINAIPIAPISMSDLL
jgi:hypothetical protein